VGRTISFRLGDEKILAWLDSLPPRRRSQELRQALADRFRRQEGRASPEPALSPEELRRVVREELARLLPRIRQVVREALEEAAPAGGQGGSPEPEELREAMEKLDSFFRSGR